MKELTLRQLCEKCGVSRRAVQGYENYGLVHSSGKTERGYLLYDEVAYKKVRYIKKMQNYGFSVREIIDFQKKTSLEKIDILYVKLKRMMEERENTDRCIQEVRAAIEKLKAK